MQKEESRDPYPMTSAAAKAMMNSSTTTHEHTYNDNSNNNHPNSNNHIMNSMSWQNTRISTHLNSKHNSHSRNEDMEMGSTTSLTNPTTKTRMEWLEDNDDDDEDEDDDVIPSSPASKRFFFFSFLNSNKLFKRMYGDIEMDDVIQSLSLSATLFFLIGGYWLLRSLKDPVLTALCGVQAIPKAKMLSVVIVLLVVFIYNSCIDFVHASHGRYHMHQLFYVFGMFYFALFVGIAFLLNTEAYGLEHVTVPSESRILGWVSYCTIESFGSVMVSLFWSFVNSNVSLEAAKSTYGFIVAAAQVGSILGPTVVQMYSTTLGIPIIYFMGACCMLVLQLTMYLYIRAYGVSTTSGDDSKKKKNKAGIMEGLKLFYQYNYIKGIFAISCLFMILVTIVDYTLKVLAREHFASEFPCSDIHQACFNALGDGVHSMSIEASQNFASFMGLFGQATNTLSFTLSLFGTSAVIRTLGLRLTLLLFPSLCLVVILFVRLNPTLWVAFAAMMLLKACSYALNNPTKEILYQPTSSNVKYKAKSWIDIFGARGSKALGSVVTNYYSYSAIALVSNGSLVGIVVAIFLIWNATYMGRTFEYLTENDVVIGEEEEEILLSNNENDAEFMMNQDTSCGIEEEGQSDREYRSENDDDDDDDDENNIHNHDK